MAILKSEGKFRSSSGTADIFYTAWRDDAQAPKAILLIAHGMAEHIARYDRFARFMAEHGYAVWGNDHLGHGRSAIGDEGLGYMADADGGQHIVRDMVHLSQIAKKALSGIPVILMGHSMGSFVARVLCANDPQAVDAAIFMGTGNPAGAKPGVWLTSVLCALRGKKHRSAMVERMANKGYNDRYPDVRTEFDWLSSDSDEVQKYLDDPWCGFRFTVSAYRELMRLIVKISSPDWAGRIPKAMPLLLIAGRDDPVGNYGTGVQQVYQQLKDAGVEDLQLTLYDGMRHEILNEKEWRKVYDDLLAWCDHAAQVTSS